MLLGLPCVQPGAAALLSQQPHPAPEREVTPDLIVHLATAFLFIEDFFF